MLDYSDTHAHESRSHADENNFFRVDSKRLSFVSQEFGFFQHKDLDAKLINHLSFRFENVLRGTTQIEDMSTHQHFLVVSSVEAS